MKVTIKLKKESSGISDATKKPWKMQSLLCSVDTKEEANEIAMHGIKSGVPQENLDKLIKENDYNGKISYQFNILPSTILFERVERYGVIDVDVENLVIKWDGKYANTKFKVIGGIEQINGYSSSNDHVTGCLIPAPETSNPAQELVDAYNAENAPILPNPKIDSLNPADVKDLPF